MFHHSMEVRRTLRRFKEEFDPQDMADDEVIDTHGATMDAPHYLPIGCTARRWFRSHWISR